MPSSTRRFDPKAFLQVIGEGKTITSFRSGEIIFKQGSAADQVFYLQSGRAKETVTSEQGKDAVVGMLEEGLFFGTSSLGEERVRHSTVTAITACIVTAITRQAMMNALQQPSFARLFLAYLLEHTSRIETEKLDLLLNSSERRLAQKLLDLAHFQEGRAPREIGTEVTQEMLADMIGTTRPRVNYFLNKWRKLNYIKYNGGIVVLPALARAMKEWEGKT